jgi:hypothetical protein
MKRFIQSSFALILLAAVAFPAVAGGSKPGNQIAGAWEVHVDLGFTQFVNLASMTSDGQIVNTNVDGTAAVGGWQRTRGRNYDITFTGFLRLDPDPDFVRSTVFSTVELSADGQEFSGPFLTEFRDLDGNLLFDVGGIVTGTRLPVIGF